MTLRAFRPSAFATLLALGLAACSPQGTGSESAGELGSSEGPPTVRVGLFNIWELGLGKMESADPEAQEQLRAAAEIVRQHRPDVLVLNEIDADPTGEGDERQTRLEAAARRFLERYLAADLSDGREPLDYPHLFVRESNTGLLSGFDLNDDGTVASEADLGERAHGDDSWGYGVYPGQYAMAVLSHYPIDASGARTFQRFLWRDLPGHHIPEGWYSEEELEQVRLSSKSHWDVPVEIDGRTLHLLVSHPTPPGFDGDEDRNGRRNFDEIRLWKLYLDGDPTIVDDQGRPGGYDAWADGAPFVIAGDLNAYPGNDVVYDGRDAISQLLEHPRVQDSGPWLTSEGALAGREPGPPEYRERSTAGFRDGVRIDHLLPSTDLEVIDGGVEWPDPETDPEGHARAQKASDHRFLWLDLRLP